jgi:hypothetical protein
MERPYSGCVTLSSASLSLVLKRMMTMTTWKLCESPHTAGMKMHLLIPFSVGCFWRGVLCDKQGSSIQLPTEHVFVVESLMLLPRLPYSTDPRRVGRNLCSQKDHAPPQDSCGIIIDSIHEWLLSRKQPFYPCPFNCTKMIPLALTAAQNRIISPLCRQLMF